MNLNRIISILCLLLFFTWEGSVSHAADSWSYPTDNKPDGKFGGGTGDLYNPYLINNAQQLADLAYMVTKKGENYEGKYFVLTNDITLNDHVLNASGTGLHYEASTYKEWTPIGDRSVWGYGIFKGIFDGQGHTIRGMVCAKKNAREYTGLFETIQNATIKNINMEDCCIKDDDAKYKSNFGILCGEAWDANTIINCTISKSAIIINSELDVCVGGILGSFRLMGPLNISNCSFNGYISFRQDDYYKFWFAGKCIGGILGFSDEENAKLHINNCSSSGDIDIFCSHDNEKYNYFIGGLGGNIHSECAFFSNCVSSMNINIDSPNSGMGYCNVGGIVNYVDTERSFSNCVYLGKIRVGYAGSPAKMEELKVCGIGGSSYVNGCAFYGKMDIHCQATYKITIAGITNKHFVGDNYKQNIVYSAGNVIDIDAPTTKIDQVCNEIEDGKKHNDFYCFGLSNGNSVDCKHSYNPATYSKTLEQMKTDDFINTLNQDAGGKIWGKLTGESDELNGLPMPIACGGKPLEYTEEGTETDPYVINTENDLNELKEAVNNGSTFGGKYFKLGSDIRITSTLDDCIGKDYEKPFKGHFDGNGHAIVGLRKSLFGYMYGTVKNLALVDCDIWVNGYATALARYVGNDGNKAEVSNCYISGTISFSTPWNQLGYASTFAFQVAQGSSIHDCYFKGRFIVKEQTFSTYNVAGIAFYNNNSTVNTSAESPKGIFNCYASFDVKVEASVMETRYTYGITNGLNNESNGNYFVCSDDRVSVNNNGGKKLGSESELNSMFNGKTGWLQGVYRPLLVSAKHYKAKSPEGADAYFDAIPEANPKKNYFYNISIDDPYSDVSLWQLPNMAVYVPNEKKDYITNGYLDQSADFQYKRSADATATAGQLRYDLTQTDKGYHMICLPGVVERDDLPDGAKVMIIGKIQTVDEQEQVNVVMVDAIPAGVPCMLYVPTTTVKTETTIPLVMRSGIVSTPTVNETYSDFKGTFSKNTNVPVGACTTAIYSGDNNTLPCFVRNTETTTAEPFTAWLEGATGNVQIVDYILLDEENEAMTVTLSEYNAKTYNIKMRRALKKDKWNTICLPYSLTSDEISTLFGSGTKVEAFSDLEYNSETNSYTMKFSAATEITAGTPYLIKPSNDVSGNIYEIKDRTITCTSETYVPTGTSQTANNTTLTMQGEYNKRKITPFDVTESENIYVISGNKIYHVNSDVEMKGFRCYFVAKESTTGPSEGGSGAHGSSMFSNAKVIHSDGTSTDLRLIDAEATGDTDAVYDLLGRKRDAQTKGLVIKNGIKVLK